MICAGQSRSVDALSHDIVNGKWWPLGDVAHECRAGERGRVALALVLNHLDVAKKSTKDILFRTFYFGLSGGIEH